MVRLILIKSKRKSPLSHVVVQAACAIGAAVIVHCGSNVRFHAFALASEASNESTNGRDRILSSPRNDESHQVPIDGGLRLKGQDKDGSHVAARRPKEKKVINGKQDVTTIKRASNSRLSVVQSRQLNKEARLSNGDQNDQSLSGTSSGDAKEQNGVDRNRTNKNGRNNGGTSEGHTSTSGGLSDQFSGDTLPGVNKKKNGADRNGTIKRKKKDRANHGTTSDAMTTNSNNKTTKMNARKKPQQMNEVTDLDSVTNIGVTSKQRANSNATDSFLTKFYANFDAKKKGGNQKTRVKRKKKAGNAGYYTPGIYADTSTSSWGSSTSSWGSSGGGKDVSYGSGKSGKESGWKPDGWEESGWKPTGWEKSDWKPAGWTQVSGEWLHDYKNSCPCTYVDAPSWGSAWGGVTAWAGSTSGTAEVSTLGTGAVSKSGTKSSKKAKRNLQWGEAQHMPEKIKICTCVPTYFPTYNPT